MRAKPSAAPVATPSNSASTQRIPSTRSSAATKCISEVPGLAKQTVTPPATSVRTRHSAPFMSICALSSMTILSGDRSSREHCRLSGAKRKATVGPVWRSPRTTMSQTIVPENRVAVITGGASGIGYASAEHLHARGWKIALLDVGDAALEEARKHLGSKPGVRVTKLDVTDEPAVEREMA